MALCDRLIAMARDLHPDKSERWQSTWLSRLLYYKTHGDMTGAPELPDE